MLYYEDKYFYYFWKKSGLASTFGAQESFLDNLEKWGETIEGKGIFEYLNDMFGKDNEYGLVNRLDNDTSGLLYFAKTPLFKTRFKELQSQSQTQKIYLADVQGYFDIPKLSQYYKTLNSTLIIDYPLAHHKFEQDRMVFIQDVSNPASYEGKIRGVLHKVSTQVELLDYNTLSNISTLRITITKGIRHQIRAHLASIGFPIIGDQIYGKEKNIAEMLHLWCIGLNIV